MECWEKMVGKWNADNIVFLPTNCGERENDEWYEIQSSLVKGVISWSDSEQTKPCGNLNASL